MRALSVQQDLQALRDKLADIMLVALREQAGFPAISEDWDRLHEKVSDALRGYVHL